MFKEEQLDVFAQVVECGSFSQAARKLSRSQAAISQAVKNLELSLEYTLFDRQGGHARVNQNGERLYQLHQQRQQLLGKLGYLAEHAGREVEREISLHLADTLEHRALAPCLSGLYRQFPFTRVRLLARWQQADLAIAAEEVITTPQNEQARAQFAWEPFCEHSLLPVCGMSVSSPQYIQVPWGPASTTVQRSLATSKLHSAWQMVRDNLGWTWIPEHLLSESHVRRDVSVLDQFEPLTRRYVIGRRHQQGPAMKWLCEQLLEHAAGQREKREADYAEI